MKKTLLLFFLLFCISFSSFSQLVLKWQKYIGGTGNERATQVIQTADSGYVILGTTDGFGAGLEDIILIKTDLNGNIQWGKTFGSTNDEYSSSLIQTYDGGFFIAGAQRDTSYNSHGICIKTDYYGNVSWSRVIDSCSFSKSFETLNGDIILYGNKEPFYSCVVKLNSTGNLIWNKTYKTSDYKSLYAQSIINNDSTFALFGGIQVANSLDYCLTLVDSSGNFIWAKNYGGTTNDYSRPFTKAVDGGYLLCGNTAGQDIYLLKVDVIGDTIWTKGYIGNLYHTDYINDIIPSNGGYVMAGQSQSDSDNYSDAYLIRINSVGDTLWTRNYGFPQKWDNAVSVRQTFDSGYIIAGSCNSDTTHTSDIYLIKTDSIGLSDTCNLVKHTTYMYQLNPTIGSPPVYIVYPSWTTSPFNLSVSNSISNDQNPCSHSSTHDYINYTPSMNIFPNPSSSNITITTDNKSMIEILNINGQIIKSIYSDSKSTTVDLTDFTSGVYIVRAKTDKEIITKKIIKE